MLRKLLKSIFKEKNIVVLKQPQTLQRNINLQNEVDNIVRENQKKRKRL